MSAIQVGVIDTGDYVLHRPTGEKWVVACVEGEYLSWMGWPEGMAKLADCELLEKATEESRLKLLYELSDNMTNDHRSRFARHIIDTHLKPKEPT